MLCVSFYCLTHLAQYVQHLHVSLTPLKNKDPVESCPIAVLEGMPSLVGIVGTRHQEAVLYYYKPQFIARAVVFGHLLVLVLYALRYALHTQWLHMC